MARGSHDPQGHKALFVAAAKINNNKYLKVKDDQTKKQINSASPTRLDRTVHSVPLTLSKDI